MDGDARSITEKATVTMTAIAVTKCPEIRQFDNYLASKDPIV